MKLIENLPYSLTEVIGAKAKVGMIVLSSDYTIEHEFRHVFKVPGVDFYQARIANSNQITPKTLAAMESGIADSLRLILPGEKLDVVAYCCTSASTVLGEDTVFKRIREVQPDAQCTTPVTAAFAAFDAFKAKRIAVLTPYRKDVNEVVCQYITNRGYLVPVFGSFNQEQDPVVARIDEASLKSAIERLVSEAVVDMVFVSCTSVPMIHAVARIEQAIGLPITSSNHAMAWHCLRMSGVDDKISDLGELYCRPLGSEKTHQGVSNRQSTNNAN